ncbi:MAG TPA: polysaccharide biosynthesis tyrosine autokinase [Clostridia bacterium]|nr:polysaccharide biosynthesis tyrosine autokinase [Clostridia bacterium]
MDNETSIDIMVLLSDLIKGIKKFWHIVLVLASVMSWLFFYVSARKYTPLYTSKATFTILAAYVDNYAGYSYRYYYNSQTASQMAVTFPYILNSYLLQEIVCEDLGVPYLNGSINAVAIPDTNLFTIMVTSTNPNDAYHILNSVIRNYPKVAEFVIGDTKMNMLSSPKVPTNPTNRPVYSRMTKIGFLAGCVLGCGFIFLYALTRTTIRKVDDVKKILNLECLGVLPVVKFKRRKNDMDHSVNIMNDKVGSAFGESIRSIRTKLLKETSDKKNNVIVVAGSVPKEGKTTLAINLSIALGQMGYSVILVDGDLRNPSVLNMLDIVMPLNGLGEILEGEQTIEQSIHGFGKYNISVLAGQKSYPNPNKLLSHHSLVEVIIMLRNMADFVIIDTPPCHLVPDAVAFVKLADHAVYCIRQDYAKRSLIIDSLTSLSYSQVNVLGAVLTFTETGIGSYGYRYGYLYKYPYYRKLRYYGESV